MLQLSLRLQYIFLLGILYYLTGDKEIIAFFNFFTALYFYLIDFFKFFVIQHDYFRLEIIFWLSIPDLRPGDTEILDFFRLEIIFWLGIPDLRTGDTEILDFFKFFGTSYECLIWSLTYFLSGILYFFKVFIFNFATMLAMFKLFFLSKTFGIYFILLKVLQNKSPSVFLPKIFFYL